MSSNAVGIFEINDRGQVYTIIGRAGSGPVCVHHCAISSSALQDQSSIERDIYTYIYTCSLGSTGIACDSLLEIN